MVPDYYTMLGVDPAADRSTIETALGRCQPLWSSGTRNPKTKHTYQSYLDQIPAIRQALLASPADRAAYDAELAAARRGERDQKLDELQRLIRLRAAKGGLTVSDRKLLRDEAMRLGLTADDLDRLTETIPPRPETPGPVDDAAVDQPVDILDPVMRRQIRLALEHLRKRDLYDALGLSRDAPGREIALRADAERQRWMKKTQVTAEKTAWLEVATLAQSHLTNPQARERYDRTLSAEVEDRFAESIQFAVKGLPRLDVGTRAVLLDEAEALGIASDRAEKLIARICGNLGIVRDAGMGMGAGGVPVAAPAGPGRLLRCRACSGITEHARVARQGGAALCRHCGASLHWTCPVCQRVHWVDEPRCGCGFRVELREPLVRHFEAAQQAFRNRDYISASAHLRRVQEYAPSHVGARKGIEKIKEKVAQIDRARGAFELARASGRLVEAKREAESWGQLVDPASPEWRGAYTEVVRLLRDAQALAERARKQAASSPKTARELYRQSLAIAADLTQASEGLTACPPDPPSELTATYVNDRVKLRWSPPPPDGLGPVTYVVLRKPDTALTHPSDGVRIGETLAPQFEDADVRAGTSMAYAVLCRRGVVESLGAVAVGPIFLLGEVRGVRIETRTREVDLTWTPPAGAIEVRVIRKRGGPPTGPLDGERIESLIDHAHDRGLESDRVYHYGIYAIYRTPEGRATASQGVVVSALPHTPVSPVEAPMLTPEADGRLLIRWVEPTRGIVKILRTLHAFPHPPGTRLTAIQVASIEGAWVEVTAADAAHDLPPTSGLCYYTPLTAWGGHTTVGHTAVYSCVTDPTDLRATRSGSQVLLRWRWSPHGNQSLVVYRPGSPPTGPDDPAARVETVHEAEYSRQGRFALTLPPGDAGPWHVAVYALAVIEGQPVTSPGHEPTARTLVPGPIPEVTVVYDLRRTRLRNRKWSIFFRTEPRDASIPPTVLVAHPRTVPLSADDGTIIAEFPACRDGASFPLPPDANLGRSRTRLFADPRAEPDGLPPIRIRHPETDVTRV